jgi:hypothetical protein
MITYLSNTGRTLATISKETGIERSTLHGLVTDPKRSLPYARGESLFVYYKIVRHGLGEWGERVDYLLQFYTARALARRLGINHSTLYTIRARPNHQVAHETGEKILLLYWTEKVTRSV